MVREFGAQGRLHFAHVRNIRFTGPGQFEEAAHFSGDGSLDLYEIMKAYHDVGFDGYIRPDHGRMIWDEQGRAGYGLYDRALGAVYLSGLWEALEKGSKYPPPKPERTTASERVPATSGADAGCGVFPFVPVCV